LAEYALFEMDGKAAYKLTVKVIDGFIEQTPITRS
jgi:hypothetical protein